MSPIVSNGGAADAPGEAGGAASDEPAHPFSADRPIASRRDDLLGRADFAESFAKAIEGWRHRDSLVVALYGAWGSGKTSLKNMTLDFLKGGDAIDIIEFSPWEWASQEQIAEAFFDQIGGALGKRGSSRNARERAANGERTLRGFISVRPWRGDLEV